MVGNNRVLFVACDEFFKALSVLELVDGVWTEVSLDTYYEVADDLDYVKSPDGDWFGWTDYWDFMVPAQSALGSSPPSPEEVESIIAAYREYVYGDDPTTDLGGVALVYYVSDQVE